jgi:endonuclease/exonuclease/phosphatase family metal-dependent hydrolase
MTCIVSWNIQNGKGVDGIVSLERIARTIRAMADPDVICLQEIARNLEFAEGAGRPDQVAQLSVLFAGYETVFGCAIDATNSSGERWQYGNLTLTRLPVRTVFHHPLPQPANGDVNHMPRQAIELTVLVDGRPMRVVNTHLEFHCERQRAAQVDSLIELQRQVADNTLAPARHVSTGPYQEVVRPADCIMCGDFNMDVASPPYRSLTDDAGGRGAFFQDAWTRLHGERLHDPTCGVHDHVQWPQGAHCRDFFFVTPGIAQRVARVAVDTRTDASDHQPVMLVLRTD